VNWSANSCDGLKPHDKAEIYPVQTSPSLSPMLAILSGAWAGISTVTDSDRYSAVMSRALLLPTVLYKGEFSQLIFP
jgi:hypothetical protein